MRRKIIHIIRNCKRTLNIQVFDKKASKTRLSKSFETKEFTLVNDCFKNENNAVFDVLLQRLIIIFLFLISLPVSAQCELDNYLKTAAENNPGLKASFNEYMAALARVPQVGALPDPTVTFGYFIQPVETKVGPMKAQMGVSQMFPWFGTLGTKKDAATQMAKSKYENFEEAKSKLFYDVKSTWYNLYFTHRAIKITKENMEILGTFQKLALVKIEAGKASSVDELRVEMEQVKLKNQLKMLTDKYNTQSVTFNNLLNMEDEYQSVNIPDSISPDTLIYSHEAIMDSIKINNHQVLNLEFKEASFEYQQAAARKMGSPSFSIGMNYTVIGKASNNVTDSGKDAIVFPAIGIKIPLYRKKYSSMVKEAVYEQEAVQNKKLDKINILQNIYEKANADYKDADRRIELNNNLLRLSQDAISILESQYSTDGKNFEEILRMERQILTYSLELEKAKTDLSASCAFINYLMGK